MINYTVTHRMGDMSPDLSVSRFPAVLAELNAEDREHSDVCLRHRTQWALSYFSSGKMVLENLDDLKVPPRHMFIEKAEALEFWKRLAFGEIDWLLQQKWSPGYN